LRDGVSRGIVRSRREVVRVAMRFWVDRGAVERASCM
jgi:hypothetical protein